MTVIWSPEAADDLERVIAYIAQRNLPAARKLAESVLAIVERLASEPLDGPAHTLWTEEIVRGWPVPPLRVYYQRVGGVIRVVRVYHQKREPIVR